MNDLRMVAITWADAHGDCAEWTDLTEVEDDGDYLVRSVGILLVGAKRGHLSIAQSITPDEDVDSVLHIPKGMVRRVEALHRLSVIPVEPDPSDEI
jgi:hypothetical protein